MDDFKNTNDSWYTEELPCYLKRKFLFSLFTLVKTLVKQIKLVRVSSLLWGYNGFDCLGDKNHSKTTWRDK